MPAPLIDGPSLVASSSTIGMSLAVIALLLFSAGTLITSVATRRVDAAAGALVATTVNVLVGSAMLAVQVWLRGSPASVSYAGAAGFVLAGLFSTYLGRWLFFNAVATLGPTRASTFQSSSPLVTALLGWLVLGERLGLAAFVGIAVAMAGLAAVSTPASAGKAPGASPASTSSAVVLRGALLLGLGGSSAYAVSNVLRAAAVRSWNEPVAGALLGASAGLACYLVAGRRELASFAHRAASYRRGMTLFAVVGVMQMIAQICTISAMRFIPASVAALITMCTPLVVLPVSYLAFRNAEAISARTIAGIALSLAGVTLVILKAQSTWDMTVGKVALPGGQARATRLGHHALGTCPLPTRWP